MPDTPTTGQRLRALIKANGTTQAVLCRKLNITPSSMSNYLADSRNPDLVTLSRLGRELGVTLDHFDPLQQPGAVHECACGGECPEAVSA